MSDSDESIFLSYKQHKNKLDLTFLNYYLNCEIKMNFELKYLIGNILVTGHFVNLPFRHLTKKRVQRVKGAKFVEGFTRGDEVGRA